MKNEKKKNPNIFLHEGHSYVTRRQLLGAGVIPFAAGMVMPTLWDVLTKGGFAEAAGVACPAVSASGDGLPAILTMHLGGGPQIGRFAVPMMTDRKTVLASAGQLGLGTDPTTYTAQSAFSNNLLVPVSNGKTAITNLAGFFGAVQAGTTATIQAKMTVIANAVDSGDDTSTNPGNMAGLVAKWITSRKAPPVGSGGTYGEQPALITPPASLSINSVTSVSNALAPATGALNATLTAAQKKAVLNMAANLSGSQAANLQAMPGGSNFASLVQCATGQNLQIAQQGGTNTDPRMDSVMQGVYGINANSSATSATVVEAQTAYCTLKGLSPISQINMGGYDYHGNDAQTVTMPKDIVAGQVVARALSAAAGLNVPIYIYVQCDGATGTSVQTAAGASPTGDRGLGSAGFLIAYKPTAAIPIIGGMNWLNGYTAGNAANTAYTSTPDGQSTAMFYNIVHSFTGATTIADAIVAGQTGAPTAAQVAAFLAM
jgi:hypothetical protein